MTQLDSSSSTAVRIDNVSKWYRRKGEAVHALSRVSLDVARSEFVSLIGPSGCGKSTMLRLAGGLLDPDRGQIEVNGVAPRDARRLKQYGFVPQHPALLPWRTVARNVSLLGDINTRNSSPGMSEQDQLQMLDEIGLGPFLDALPRELSGGLQQRVSIARAFALGAPVLLMDEPFSALDEITRAEMRYLLLEMWERAGSTVLFVTHSIPEAVVLSDRVVVLGARPGRITEIVDVPLPRPRHADVEDTDAFHEVLARVRSALRQGYGSQ
ncbi:MAG: ABC transporter ATP-binding protein [Actinomycetia bacterium]|nr:ABC transporter ATP-binding protein [Actinomycetes bacterium]